MVVVGVVKSGGMCRCNAGRLGEAQLVRVIPCVGNMIACMLLCVEVNIGPYFSLSEQRHHMA